MLCAGAFFISGANVALPSVIVTKAGRRIFKDAGGRFISEAKFNLLNRRDPSTGKFISGAKAAKRGTLQAQESRLRAQLGAPPRGKSWVNIANKYQERFSAYLR